MLKKTAVFLLFVVISLNVYAQETWKLHTEKDGVKVFTKSILTSRVKALKIETILPATLSELVTVLMDIERETEWVYSTKSCVVVKRVSPSDLYYYSEVELPWPAQNRDFVAHIMVSQNPSTKVVTMDAPCVSGFVAQKPGIVRIVQSTGKWIITPVSKRQVKVEYTLAVDPAGSIPAWLVNLVASQGPLETFKMLKIQLQKPEYRNARLSFITD
ncbi:START domain-containing protein [Dyadobacter sp. CY345]|uniref:START domain-containing protein n=1 Tax=Dyadobacter sp. CY345 TaxID=2909335 RepID=UPI001F22D0D1|nr:START domain-containing protein [Dyadobacter sp. CY345]MCF2446545.1 START domain-containing protein [Dyadobacter sp. CY345]